MEELLALADRLVVLNEGVTNGELPAAGASPDDVLALLAGQAAPGASPAQPSADLPLPRTDGDPS